MNKSDLTIAELALELQQCVTAPLMSRLGKAPQVVLVDDGLNKIRRKRKDASAERWSADHGDQILIRFTPVQYDSVDQPVDQSPSGNPSSQAFGLPAETYSVAELVEALNRAEHRRGFDFVALKWFRDTALPMETFNWAKSDSSRRHALSEAIEKRLILTNKVPNPKSPFPVTSIRLNRSMPEVAKLLGEGLETDLDFHPVEIRGEPLSTTIIRERRQ